MNNQGKITVFLCLMLSSLLMLGLAIIGAVKVYSARGKVTMCARTAMYNVRAGYNSYIFEHYHILLFDMNQGGKGEAYIEEKIVEDMEANLGTNFKVQNCAITKYVSIADDDYKAFKEQIEDYILYAAIEDVGEEIISSTDGMDGTIPSEILDEMNDTDNSLADSMEADSLGDEEEETSTTVSDVDDPREYTTWLGNFGILTFIVPEGMSPSRAKIDTKQLPSRVINIDAEDVFKINTKFDDIDVMEDDLLSHSSWISSLGEKGAAISYAKTVFNSATDGEKNTDTVLEYEMEYLIAGKTSDYENLESVGAKIVAIRLPVNYAYLVSDSVKMSEVSSVATPLSILVGIPQPILKYLLAGCWSYVESLVEVRALLEGKTLPFKKDSSNWITDFNDLENSKYDTAFEDEKGLDYEDYLCILLAFEGDDIYERMLDVIQINTWEYSGEISLLECAVELYVDLNVTFEGGESSFNMGVGY